MILDPTELAGDCREEIRRLRERICKARPMAAVRRVALVELIPIREQHRVAGALSLDAYIVRREDIRPVLEVGDPPEALRLTLRAEYAR